MNYLGILVAALVYFAVQGVWFTVLRNDWLAGIGKTMDELQRPGTSVVLAYAISFIGALVLAATISGFTQMTGRQTAFRGAWIAILAWIGFILTTWSAEYAFEGRGAKILAVTTGAPLLGMVLMGVILGAWKATPKSAV